MSKNPYSRPSVKSVRFTGRHGFIFGGVDPKGTSVCFKCRTATRTVSRIETDRICPDCKGEMRYIGTKWRIPIRSNIKGWKKMKKRFKDPLIKPKTLSRLPRRSFKRELKELTKV